MGYNEKIFESVSWTVMVINSLQFFLWHLLSLTVFNVYLGLLPQLKHLSHGFAARYAAEG